VSARTVADAEVVQALLGIVYSGDWLSFIKEALNMRTTAIVYRLLEKYLDAQDAEAQKKGLPEDPTIDPHFRSGVYLGVGVNNIILSLLPSRLISVIELFGYKGDRALGLRMLEKAGGWSKDSDEPSVSIGASYAHSSISRTLNARQRRRASDAASATSRS